MYIPTYTLGHVHVYTHISLPIRRLVYAHTHTHIPESTHIHTLTYIDLYVHTSHNSHIYAHIHYTYMSIHTAHTHTFAQTCVYTHRNACWTAPVAGSPLHRRKEWVVAWKETLLSLGSAVALDLSTPRKHLFLLFAESVPGSA